MKLVFHYLSLLNIVDGVLTYIGLSQSLIQEANPIMNILYTIDPFLFLGVKLSFSFILYTFIFYDKIPTKQWFKSLTSIAVFVYTCIFFLHGIWLYHSFEWMV
jgi:hypothetical protein